MIWFAFALAGAFCQAIYGLAVKVLQKRIHPFRLAGFSFLTASVFLFSSSFFSGIPTLGPGLLPAIAVTVIINIIATALFYHALAVSDLSLCTPMLAFTPVFLTVTSFVILGEVPTAAGTIGILLVAIGAWLLALKYSGGAPVSLAGPFRILWNDRGVQAMLLVAFLYSISVNYDKEVVLNSDPVFGSAVVFFLLGSAFLFMSAVFPYPRAYAGSACRVSYQGGLPASPGPDRPGPEPEQTLSLPGLHRISAFIAVGLLLTAETIFINTAYLLSIVPYVISVKRLSIFFSVLFAGLILREPELRERIAGATVMIAGAVVIGLWG